MMSPRYLLDYLTSHMGIALFSFLFGNSCGLCAAPPYREAMPQRYDIMKREFEKHKTAQPTTDHTRTPLTHYPVVFCAKTEPRDISARELVPVY